MISELPAVFVLVTEVVSLNQQYIWQLVVLTLASMLQDVHRIIVDI